MIFLSRALPGSRLIPKGTLHVAFTEAYAKRGCIPIETLNGKRVFFNGPRSSGKHFILINDGFGNIIAVQ